MTENLLFTLAIHSLTGPFLLVHCALCWLCAFCIYRVLCLDREFTRPELKVDISWTEGAVGLSRPAER